jgi:putative effector of murein hydrolase LrgA (UPF0299 family)
VSWLTGFLRREPAMSAGITSAVVALAAAFGLSLPADVVGGVLAVLTLALGAVVRSRVTPVKAAVKGEHEAP